MYCIYLRKSRADYEAEQRGEGETLSRHRSILTALAAHNRHPIGQIYEEIVSGETLSQRPQARQLLADLAAGRWLGVYVMEVERLSRGDAMDQGYIAHAFKASGAKIITPTKTYNPADDQTDETFFEFSLFMSRQEFKTHYRRMQGGRAQSRQEGKWIVSKAPYGYRRIKIPHDKGYTLEIFPDEAAVVRQVFTWYLDGIDGQPAGITVIGNRLTQLHIPLGLNGTVWDNSRVYRMLTNPAYIGKIQWGKYKTERVITPTGVQKRTVHNKDYELTDGLHPAIIDEETFYRVQDKLKGVSIERHIPVRKDAQLVNPLAGLVVCAECGHIMSHLPTCGRQPAMIKCLTRGCPTVQSYRAPVEETVLNTLRAWLDDAGETSSPAASPMDDDRTFILSAISGMEGERDKLLKQIDRLHDLVEQGVYTIEQYNDRYVKLHLRLQEVNAALATEQQRLTDLPAFCTKQELAPAIIRLLDVYDTSTPSEQNALLKQCISKIVYSKSTQGCVIRGHVYSSPNSFNLKIFPKLK